MTEPLFPLAGKRVWVAGHAGMVGAALVRRLQREPCEVLTADRAALDLTRQAEVEAWMAQARPDAVFLAAAKVGGILANDTYPGEFLQANLAIELNVIEASRRAGVAKLMFLGSSCIYPRLAPQPIPEEALLTGPLEPTNEAYAVAKIAGLKLAQAYRKQYGCDFISAMPTNLYGPGDNFDLAASHVVPALIRKAHEAPAGIGAGFADLGQRRGRREFLHVEDCADALVFLMQHYSGDGPINVGTGEDLTILELAQLVARIVGFRGGIRTDPSKPDGAPRKLLSVAKLNGLGWSPRIALSDGLAATYQWFLHQSHVRGAA